MNQESKRINNLKQNGGVSQMLESIIQKYKEDYISLLIRYRESSKNKKLNSKFLSSRPWIIVNDDTSIEINIEHLKQGMNIESINKTFLKIDSIINTGTKIKYPLLLKSLEDNLFNFVPQTFKLAPEKEDNYIISLNNGELNLVVQGFNSLKLIDVTSSGNKLMGECSHLISQVEDDFLGIKVKLTHKDMLPFKVNIDEASKKESLQKLAKQHSRMNADVQQMWRIVVNRYIKLASEGRLENGCAYISIEDIYFNYKKGKGSGEYGTSVPKKVREDYMSIFLELEKYTVDIDYSNTSNKLIKYIKNNTRNRKIINNSSLFKIIDVIKDVTVEDYEKVITTENNFNDSVLGITYQLGEIGKIYIEDLSITQLNYRYPKDLLALHSRNHSTASFIGDFLEYQHRNRVYKKNKEFKFSLAKLIDVGAPDFDFSRFTRSMTALLRQLEVASNILIENDKIESIDYPKTIVSAYKKRIEEIYITVKFKYTPKDTENLDEEDEDFIDEDE